MGREMRDRKRHRERERQREKKREGDRLSPKPGWVIH